MFHCWLCNKRVDVDHECAVADTLETMSDNITLVSDSEQRMFVVEAMRGNNGD